MWLLPHIGSLASWISGSAFLLAGLVKAIEPQGFVRHLNRLRLLPHALLHPAVLAIVAFQCGLGTALLLRLWPDRLLPAAFAVTVALAVLGYWSTVTGRTEDCGCYNGLLAFSPLQSLQLDGALCLLLVVAWMYGEPVEPAIWRVAAVIAAAATAAGMAFASFSYVSRVGRPLVELSPLKIGHRFDPRWLGGGIGSSVDFGERIVILLGATCPHCRKWVKVLNLAHRIKDLPEVIGAVGVPERALDDYRRTVSARFPVAALKPWQMARLARGVTPTIVVVRHGIICEKWVGTMPDDFANRLRTEILDSDRKRVQEPGRS